MMLFWAAIDLQLMLWIGLTQIQNELLNWCNVFAGNKGRMTKHCKNCCNPDGPCRCYCHYAELERRTLAHMTNVRGQEGTGRTRYTERVPGPYNDMPDEARYALRFQHDGERRAFRLVDFSFAYGRTPAWAVGDMVDGPLPADDTIECTEYRELPPEQLLLPSGEEQNNEG